MKYILLITFISYVIILSFFSRADFPEPGLSNSYFPYLSDRPLTEDGFYSLKIAWNIGIGKGITYNYDQTTTGFQPLYVFLLSIVALINSNLGGDKITFIRLVILCSGVIALILFNLFYRFTMSIDKKENSKILYVTTILLVLFNFKLFLNLFNGLETGLYLIFLGLAISQTQKIIEGKKNYKQILLFGFTLGLTVLVRNDFILIAIIILITLLVAKKISIKDSILISFVLLITISPWFIYVFSVQGSLIPSSASVQTGLTNYELFYRIDQFFYSIFTSYIPFLHAGQTQSFVIYLLAFVFFSYLFKYHKPMVKSYFRISVIRYWLTAILIISFVYLVFASQPYFFFRYLSIHVLIAIPFLAILFTKVLSNRSSIFKNIFVSLVVLIFLLNVGYYFHYPKEAKGLVLRASFISDNNLFNEKIGMAQSGISGYFFDNVENLDGKVNSKALSAIKENHLYDYIINERIKLLIEWKEWFDKLPAEEISKYWYKPSEQIRDSKSLVLERK